MDIQELSQIAADAAPRHGWDFSCMNVRRAPVPWDYREVVQRFLTPTSRVLDIGTGGGERLARLAPAFERGIGIDADPAMLDDARATLGPVRAANVELAHMDGQHLGFPAESFDVVLNRQAPVHVPEIVRVLKPGGFCVTQQVGEWNTHNICAEFGCGPSGHYATGEIQDVAAIADAFSRRGCEIHAQADYDVPYWFRDVKSFVFWLQAIPLPNDLHIPTHAPIVKRIIETHWTADGLRTNEHRRLLIARKPVTPPEEGIADGR